MIATREKELGLKEILGSSLWEGRDLGEAVVLFVQAQNSIWNTVDAQ